MFKLKFRNTGFAVLFSDASELDLLLDVEQSMVKPEAYFYSEYHTDLEYVGDDEEIKSLFERARVDLGDVIHFMECIEWIEEQHDEETAMMQIDYLICNRGMCISEVAARAGEVQIRTGSLADVCQDDNEEMYSELPSHLKRYIDWSKMGADFLSDGEYDEIDDSTYVTNGNSF